MAAPTDGTAISAIRAASPASALTGTEAFALVQGGFTKGGIISQILAYIQANATAFDATGAAAAAVAALTSVYQPLDSDLTSIATLSTTSFGRSFLALVDAAAARTLAAAAPAAAKYIVQTADGELSAEQALGALASGYLKNTTTTGVLSVQATPIPASDIAVAGLPAQIGVAVSDETTAITTGTAKLTFRMPYAMTLTSVRASLKTASSSGIPAINIKENGVTIFSTTLTIDATEKTSTTAAVPAVISDPNLADDAEMTVDIDTAGTGAVGLKLWLIGTRA